MNELLTERSENILRVQFNRPAKKNAMTAAMYTGLADLLNEADKDDNINVVLLHGAGDSFTAGNDLEDFVKNPPGPGDSPQARLINALIRFSKPLVAAVHGVAIGGGTTILTHFDFVYAAENTKFQIPFINLALVPEFGSSYLASKTNRISPGGRIDSVGWDLQCGTGERTGPGDCCRPRSRISWQRRRKQRRHLHGNQQWR